MKIEKYKHTGEIITGNMYIPQSIYNELGGDKKLIWDYIMGGNSIIVCEPDGSGFSMSGYDNYLGEIYWVNDKNTYLELF